MMCSANLHTAQECICTRSVNAPLQKSSVYSVRCRVQSFRRQRGKNNRQCRVYSPPLAFPHLTHTHNDEDQNITA